MRLTELDYMHATSMEIFHQSALFSTHPQKRVWRRIYVAQILNRFPGRETICKYKKLVQYVHQTAQSGLWKHFKSTQHEANMNLI
jgi:hypothetical protein